MLLTPPPSVGLVAPPPSFDFSEMMVVKRNGCHEPVSFDKILWRVKKIGQEAQLRLNYSQLTQEIIAGICNGITTTQIDELTAAICASKATDHVNYGILAGHVAVSNLHKNTVASFSSVMRQLYDFHETVMDPATAQEVRVHKPQIDKDFMQFVERHAEALDGMVNPLRDYLLDYFGLKTMEKSYLLTIGGRIQERPQHMFMRVAVEIHYRGVEAVFDLSPVLTSIRESYDMMSLKRAIHATPTLFNAGTPFRQLSSCFLLAMQEDSLEGIYDTLKDTALISKYAGGIGLHVHNIRATGTSIKGTNGKSNGLVPMLGVFNKTSRYVDQGGGKRSGSFAIYLEPWHADVEAFLNLPRNGGDENTKSRDLFYALWIPDLFMRRVQAGEQWSLFCPHVCPGLADVHGAAFDQLYTTYEQKGMARKTLPAQDLWRQILSAQEETGRPYLLFKDACNAKSNQQNLGTIKSSNLCAEIIEYSDAQETAVCNLASISLPAFVKSGGGGGGGSGGDVAGAGAGAGAVFFDFDELFKTAQILITNLNKIIDINYYATEKCRRSNMRHRPIGIGVQGLADAFAMMGFAFGDEGSRRLNREIFETIYYAALSQSCELAKIQGTYPSFHENGGCPASRGILQFDFYSEAETQAVAASARYNWTALKTEIQTNGLRNSLLVALMPTASTSQMLGNTEGFEPFSGLIYTRRTLAGEFIVVNRHLMADLTALGLWTAEIRASIKERDSVQHIKEIPQTLREKYLTVYELSMKHVIEMAAERAPFVCQSQSMNLYMKSPTHKKMTAMFLKAWMAGLKTGCYYFKREAPYAAQQVTIPVESIRANITTATTKRVPSRTRAGRGGGVSSSNGGGMGNREAEPEVKPKEEEEENGVCEMCMG